MVFLFARVCYLILPWDGHAARVELGVKVFIVYIKVDSLHRGELVDIHDIMAVHGFWLWKQKASRHELHKWMAF